MTIKITRIEINKNIKQWMNIINRLYYYLALNIIIEITTYRTFMQNIAHYIFND